MNTTPNTTVRDRVTALDSALSEITDRVARAADHLARLDAQIERSTTRLARGTLEGASIEASPPAPGAPLEPEMTVPGHRRAKRDTLPTPPPVHVPDALESALRAAPASVPELARKLGESPARVNARVARLRKEGHLYNVGTVESPRWFWIVGDDATPAELRAAVHALITDRPMTNAELLAATGARRGRVSGQIVDLQRTGKPVQKLGTERRARWFLPTAKP